VLVWGDDEPACLLCGRSPTAPAMPPLPDVVVRRTEQDLKASDGHPAATPMGNPTAAPQAPEAAGGDGA
jgi:hypothetical protein